MFRISLFKRRDGIIIFFSYFLHGLYQNMSTTALPLYLREDRTRKSFCANDGSKKTTNQISSDISREVLRAERQVSRTQPDYLEDAIKRLENSKPTSRKAIIFW